MQDPNYYELKPGATIGQLVEALSQMPAEAEIVEIAWKHSIVFSVTNRVNGKHTASVYCADSAEDAAENSE